jgi:adenosylcobinamide hydrolase
MGTGRTDLPELVIAVLPGNEQVVDHGTMLVVRFTGPRNVLSTSWLNGGYRKDLRAVFNHQIPVEACESCHNGGSVRDYLKGVARGLGFDAGVVTGLVTRAEMRNIAIRTEQFRDLAVTAIVTAGIDKNGGRAGDPASYYEDGDSFEPVGGTINTILVIGADLPEHAMARALMTASEAKAAALQQPMARSLYSCGIATGSGTDMIAIVSDPGSRLRLTDAGKHAKLGELIGRTVIRATTEALEMETGLSAESQRDVLVRLSRFGVTREDLWNACSAITPQGRYTIEEREVFLCNVSRYAKDPELVVPVAAALHIIDEAEWGLITETTACQAVRNLFPVTVPDGPHTLADRTPLNELLAGLSWHICSRRDKSPFTG